MSGYVEKKVLPLSPLVVGLFAEINETQLKFPQEGSIKYKLRNALPEIGKHVNTPNEPTLWFQNE